MCLEFAAPTVDAEDEEGGGAPAGQYRSTADVAALAGQTLRTRSAHLLSHSPPSVSMRLMFAPQCKAEDAGGSSDHTRSAPGLKPTAGRHNSRYRERHHCCYSVIRTATYTHRRMDTNIGRHRHQLILISRSFRSRHYSRIMMKIHTCLTLIAHWARVYTHKFGMLTWGVGVGVCGVYFRLSLMRLCGSHFPRALVVELHVGVVHMVEDAGYCTPSCRPWPSR